MMTALLVGWLAQQAPTWTEVQAVFAKHCNACHDAKESKGELVLTSYANALKGGESGPAWVPGKPAESPILALVEHARKPFMPPPKK
ncbi:MAG TPA: c-type cytochrome domain-containing protein, partial [Planctomycetota bacterium]|nr:c-type cytochrome domain-containing protein [Planctomycetota bacterium]